MKLTKLTNRKIVFGMLAGAAGLLLTGNATAANTPGTQCSMPACCKAASTSSSADAKAKPDLLKTCPVSGEKLGEMSDPYVFTYQGQEVKLCCKSCQKKFDKDPAKYLKIIRAADKK